MHKGLEVKQYLVKAKKKPKPNPQTPKHENTHALGGAGARSEPEETGVRVRG